MKYIDAHVHLQAFSEKCTGQILTKAKNRGVKKVVSVTAKSSEWKDNQILSSTPSIIPAFGIHPWFVQDETLDKIFDLEKILIDNPQALIGEIGLDGNKEAKELQEIFFEQQLSLAQKYHRPVIIHAIKSQAWFEKNWNKLPQKFLFHSYNGKPDFLKNILDHGGFVSFSFSILNNAKKSEILKSVPLEKMVLETDSPYQAPDKNQLNTPENLPELVFELAKILEIDYETFAKRIYQNTLEFVKIG